MKKTNFLKISVLLILSITLLCGMFPGRTYAADTVSGRLEAYKDNNNATPNGHLCSYVSINNYYFNEKYCTHSTKNMGGGAKDGIYESMVLYSIKVNGKNHPAYCIEPGAPVDGAWAYNGATGITSTDPYWQYICDEYPVLFESIGLTIGYTAQYKNNSDYKAARTACQIIIWEFMANYRDRNTKKVTDPTLRNAMAGSNFVKYYDLISNNLVNHDVIPSYTSKTADAVKQITLGFDTVTQTWSTTVTSTTGEANLLDYSSLSASGVTINTSGQKLTLTTSKQFSTAQTKSVSKILPDSLFNEDLYVWTAYDENGDRGQCIVSGVNAQPVSAYIKIATEAIGELKITKTSEDDVISGVSFSVSDGKNSYAVKTDSSGIAKIKLTPGTYTVTELNTPNRYETPKSATVTVKANTTVTVDVNNVLRKGTLKIVKTSTDNNVENVKFTVTNSSGYSKVVYTDKNGVATISELLPGNYNISEATDDNIYYVPENQTVTVTADKTATVNFSNINKRKLTVRYFDKYTLDVIHEEYTYTDKHKAPYDVTEQTAVMIDGYEFIDRIEGDAVSGILNSDKIIDVYYGYNHNVTVNYYDKYTNEVINTQYLTEQIEHSDNYDVSEQILKEIDYQAENSQDTIKEYSKIPKVIKYYHFPELNAGDAISGVLDSDKVINLYYGYDHNVTIEYRDEDTGEIISETVEYNPEGEHNADYDKTDDIELKIEGYTKTKITGDNEKGTLDTDKSIVVWYKKNPEPAPEPLPETADSTPPVTLCGLTLTATCVCTLFCRKKKKDN